MAPVEFLASWYLAQCNQEWEHLHGVTIETLDAPGWMVTVDLMQTSLEGRTMAPVREDRSPQDWLTCTVESNVFRGQGDAHKLDAILTIFRDWATDKVE
jgi:hypothetical protein